MKTRMLATLSLVTALVPGSAAHTAADELEVQPAPRLILQITVDQLRGDLIERYESHFGEGGFKLLLDRGVVFADAHHDHANTETIVGHVTLATGAHPSAHGLVGNVWFDRETDRLTYNIEDERYPLLTAGADVDKATEIDPTQKVASSDGRSPAAILTSTFSDELALHTAGRSKIFGVSVKDRGAVSLAGHAGKAFWFSKKSGEFVTSRFYYERYPDWVEAFNAEKHPQAYAGKSWTLSGASDKYLFGDRDDHAWETNFPGYGRTFPHTYGPGDGKYFTTLLTLSPAGDELTAAFAKRLIENEALGRDEVIDYLAVSFSSTDYVGHLFGPSSLEQEENIARLDRTLADLLAFVEQKVGLDRTIVVLSADHGGPEAPGYLAELGLETGYVDPESWDKAAGIATLKVRFGVGSELIKEYFHPYVYLDRELIRAKGLDQAEVEAAVAREVEKLDGVAMAISSTALAEGRVPDTETIRAVLANHHPKRSGDIFVVFEPHRFINDFDGLTVAATHGSPWNYDTHVPLVFAMPGMEGRRVTRRVSTTDLAPTLSALVGAKAPSSSVGRILGEVVDRDGCNSE